MVKNLSVRDMSSKDLKIEFDRRWYKFKDMPTHVNYSSYAEIKRELERRGMSVCLTGFESSQNKNSEIEYGM